MTSTMMMDRAAVNTMHPMGMQGHNPAMTPASPNYLMVPRCTFGFEKIQGGMKITCAADDPMARSMVQNLCQALMGGMATCVCTLNGVAVCTLNLTMGLTRCEVTDTGCCVTCTSGDAKCCEMIQSCCSCLATLCEGGCACCLVVNGTPVCCGCITTPAKAKR